MLKELHLERFKKFENVRVQFSPFTVLMGENSSGKTTILQALNLSLVSLSAFNLIENDSSGNARVRAKGVGLSRLPGIDLSDYREVYYAKRSRASRIARWVGANLALTDTKENTYRLQLASLFGGFNIKCISSNEDISKGADIQNRLPLLISGFVGLNANEERIFPVALLDRLRSGHVSSVIRNLIFDTERNAPDRFKKLKDRLAHDFDFHLDQVSFDEEKDVHVTAQYAEMCESKRLSLDFSSSGSGFMQVLQILAPIYRYCPDKSNIVLLDEPDAHLHPNLQTTLASSLRKIRDELDIQIIVSTHSTSIIRAASPSEIVPISSAAKSCGPLTHRRDVEQEIKSKIDSYSLAKSVISGKLVFFEDSDTSILEECDDVLSTRVFKGANTASIVRGRGKTDRVPFQIKEVLSNWVSEDIEIVFFRDGDGLPPEWRSRLEEFASKRGVRIVILERFEVESYLLNGELISRAIQKKHPDSEVPAPLEVEKKIKDFLKDTITLSKYHYDDSLEEELHQVAILMNLGEYRNPQTAKSEVRTWHQKLEAIDSIDELLKYGMGSEALSSVLRWLNDEMKLSISVRNILDTLRAEDLPTDLLGAFSGLKSKEHRENPQGIAARDENEDDPDEIELKIDNLLLNFGDQS